MSRRVLIITYYWPPSGGAGVQRWLKFVKYLPAFGWTPVVYTVKNGEYPVLDPSLEKDVPPGTEVIRRKIFEPYSWYKKFIGQNPEERINAGFLSESEKPSRKERMARWIRGNLFIPDARKFWIRPSIRFLTRYLKEHPVDVLVTTGPPHSMHLIGLGLKKRLNTPWIADFRDPWTNIDFYEELRLTRWADRKHHRLEETVIKRADAIVSISRTMQKEFESKGARASYYIPNGYDHEDFPQTPLPHPEKFTLLHAGTLGPARNPENLWKVLRDLVRDPEFEKALEIQLIGKIDISVKSSIERYGLKKFTSFIPYLSHRELIVAERRAAVLLLLVNRSPNAKGILTGKLFEYLAIGRPILSIGPPDGEAAQILEETKRGKTSFYDDQDDIRKNLWEYYRLWKENDIFKSDNTTNYSRQLLSKEISELFFELTKQNHLS